MIKNIYFTSGQAKASDVAPATAQFGIKINPGELARKLNEHEISVQYPGVRLIAEFYVQNNSIHFNVKTPITSQLLKSVASENSINGEKVLCVTFKQLQDVALKKLKDLNTSNLEAACKVVGGSARSCGIKVLCDTYDDDSK